MFSSLLSAALMASIERQRCYRPRSLPFHIISCSHGGSATGADNKKIAILGGRRSSPLVGDHLAVVRQCARADEFDMAAEFRHRAQARREFLA